MTFIMQKKEKLDDDNDGNDWVRFSCSTAQNDIFIGQKPAISCGMFSQEIQLF